MGSFSLLLSRNSQMSTLYSTVKHTHTRLTVLCQGLPGWASTRKVKTNPDFNEARDSEWQWHQMGHMQGCTSFQTDNHASTPPLSFLQAGCPSCRPTNSVKALKAVKSRTEMTIITTVRYQRSTWVESIRVDKVTRKNVDVSCTVYVD